MKTRSHTIQATLRLFLDEGITFGEPYRQVRDDVFYGFRRIAFQRPQFNATTEYIGRESVPSSSASVSTVVTSIPPMDNEPLEPGFTDQIINFFTLCRRGQVPLSEHSPPQEKPQAAIGLFAAFAFFDKFPLNPLFFDREFRGNLSNLFVPSRLCGEEVSNFCKKNANLPKMGYPPYAARAPPLLTFWFSKFRRNGGIPNGIQLCEGEEEI